MKKSASYNKRMKTKQHAKSYTLYIMFPTFSRIDTKLSMLADKTIFLIFLKHLHTGQCKRTGGCYNEKVVAFFSTGGGIKGKKNIYPLTLLFIYKLAFILFVMTPGAQTTVNIAVYGSVKQLVI